MQASETDQSIDAGNAVRTGGPSGPRAGFWKRFAASFTDGIVLFIPIVIIDIALKGVGEAGGAAYVKPPSSSPTPERARSLPELDGQGLRLLAAL